jgi:hydroxymethylpyrimidine pyrophosphatase-like HAD family hydrolase
MANSWLRPARSRRCRLLEPTLPASTLTPVQEQVRPGVEGDVAGYPAKTVDQSGGGRVRLVATDLDGTLLDPSGKVTPRTARAVATARAAGIHVVPVTGRPPQAMWDLAAAAGLGPLGVCSNGAAIVDLERGDVIEVEAIAGEIGAGLVDLLRLAIPGILLATDNLDCFSFERGFFSGPVDWQERLEEVADIRPFAASGCIKLIARTGDTTALELVELLERVVGEEGHVTSSGLDWVDIGAPQVSKAYALERVCDRLGVGIDEVVAVGDNHNDLSVLAWAGTAMAPANAIDTVLAVAARVLPPNWEEGVAYLLEELVSAGRVE